VRSTTAADAAADAEPGKRATHLHWARESARSSEDVEQVRCLAGAIVFAHLPDPLRARFLKGNENAPQTGWSPTTDLASLSASVSRLHAQGQTDIAADVLRPVSLHCFWAPPDSATRAALIASAEGLGLPPLSHHLFNIRAHIAPLGTRAERPGHHYRITAGINRHSPLPQT